jgi:hypothetical protein
MGKFRKRAETSLNSFRRKVTTHTEPGATILVVTEGVNTEPAYFQWIRERFAAPTVELVAHGAGRGDPRALADEALRLSQERKRALSDRSAGINRLESYDAIWIVFDTDVLEPGKRHDGIAYARSKGIHVASSEPCFEYWLLLHQTFTTAMLPTCADVIPFLELHLGWEGYSRLGKKRAEVGAMMERLVEKAKLQKAVAHAERVRAHHIQAQSPYPANPSTEVDLLLKAINEAVSPATRFL